MSQFIMNQSCDMCKNTDTGLVRMTVGDAVHHLCYPLYVEIRKRRQAVS